MPQRIRIHIKDAKYWNISKILYGIFPLLGIFTYFWIISILVESIIRKALLMKPVKIFSYDGSFRNFLGTMYQILQSDCSSFRLTKQQPGDQPGLFGSEIHETPPEYSEKLWEALRTKAIYLPRLVYFAFLSEEPDCEMVLANYICAVFGHGTAKETDRAGLQRKLARWARAVELEKTELESSLLFVSAGKRIPECHIAPKYNVLPLLSRHFRMRFGSSSWMIVDRKRNYGLFGSDGKVEIVHKGWEELRNVPINASPSSFSENREVRPAI